MVYRITAEADRKYVEEFRENPITSHHSPGLQRVLNVMRLFGGGDQYILVARKEFQDYVIARMPPLRDDPIVIEDDMVFTSREAAEWELFRRRWRQHTGEMINDHYDDRTA
jgi:hypothetical protein